MTATPTDRPLRDILFVLNPVSGDIDKTELEHTIGAYCAAHGRTARFHHTHGHNDLEELRMALQQRPPDALFAAGGDGTASLAAEAVDRKSVV